MCFLVENVCAGGLASWLAVVEFRAFRTCFHVALRRKFVVFQGGCMGFHNSKYSFSLGFQCSQQVLCVCVFLGKCLPKLTVRDASWMGFHTPF